MDKLVSPNILCIETSTTVCSTAVFRGDQLLASRELFTDRSHAEQLHIMIEEVVNQASITLPDVHAVCVSSGPGSYTGLRIGVSAAKGLCFALEIPLLAINTLECMARAFQKSQAAPTHVCSMIDARRMEVYALLLDPTGAIAWPSTPLILQEDCFDAFLTLPIVLIGDGATKAQDVFAAHSSISYNPDLVPLAKDMGALALNKWRNQSFENTAYFEPFYLKEFYTPAPKTH